jgi:hypothetical protein
MRAAWILPITIVCIVACSKRDAPAPPPAKALDPAAPVASEPPTAMPAAADEPAPVVLPPATLTDVNLAITDMGGAVEELRDSYAPGLAGLRLIDGLQEPTWRAPANWWAGGMYSQIYWTKYPQDIVVSFYERKPALVGAVTFVLPDGPTVPVLDERSTAPADVEVWTSMSDAPDGFSRVVAVKLEPRGGEQTITFPATEARFVKLRLLSGATARVVEIAELRVLESVRDGYEPLFVREPAVKLWKGSPRQAAQRGLDWLQQAAVDWGERHDRCFGCHVQAQALMGQAVALEKDYRVTLATTKALTGLMRQKQTPEGTIGQNHYLTSAVFGAMGYASAAAANDSSSDREFLKVVDYVLKSQAPDGGIPEEFKDPPIVQGRFMMTGNALTAFEWAAAHSKDPIYRQAAQRAIAWIAANDPETIQDRVFKVVAVNRYGNQEQKRAAWSLVETLAAQQEADGGWKESPAEKGSNAFATGQVLYALKHAGVSVRSEMFVRGVNYLLQTQVNDPAKNFGSWKAVHTFNLPNQHASDFAPTMWAVIGLAGAYGIEPKGALQVMREGDRIAARNLEIVLDVSGSMKAKLGEATRWQTALDTLKEVVAALPDDLNVGMRVYGHRYSSKSPQTCQDTELVVPIAPLDRERILATANALVPRGETPLIRSILKTVGDLKAAGGGSVILITDGEESCKGDAKAAAREIKASGVNVALNIVGFTLTGEKVAAELGALAGSTGGRYYSAQDGAQLSRAVKLAALSRLPYELRDGAGKLVASGQTSELSRELPPGSYRIRVNALDQVLEDSFTIVADQTTTLRLGVEGDRFVLMR